MAEERITLISHNGKRDLAAHTTELIATLNREHNAGYLDAYDQTVPLDNGGAIVISKARKYNFYIYYLTQGNTLYTQQVKSIPFSDFEEAVVIAKELNSKIHHRSSDAPPPAKTFALEAGYIDVPMDKFDERVTIGLPVSSMPGIL